MSRTFAAAVAVTILTACALSGCAQGGGSPATPTGTRSSQSATPQNTPTAPLGSPAPTPGTTPAAGECATTALIGSIAPAEGGAAGHVGVTLVLKNHGTTHCWLQGWPGVSFVGKGNGTQLGAPATFLRNTSHPVVTLQPGGTAQALLLVANAAAYPAADCDPQKADGFRVYPPGSYTSVFVEDGEFTACAKTTAPLLQVGALNAP